MAIPKNILDKVEADLHLRPNHPVGIVRDLIYKANPDFETFNGFYPVVSTWDNFDSLLIPADHPSRKPTDTYYTDDGLVLRTHTSAHQVDLLRKGMLKFLVTGPVFRKDDIDATHYPVFHQMEGVKLVTPGVDPAQDLQVTMTKTVRALFPDAQVEFRKDYFPFTEPSWEVVMKWGGKELEVAGCGVIHPGVLKNAGVEGRTGWAFGWGLERLAMILFKIPDIRLFWSQDKRFLDQFEAGKITEFKPFSSHPACYKDIAFWVPPDYDAKEFYSLVRDVAGDLVEEVKEIDSFKKDDRTSKCYRITYRSMDSTLTNEHIDGLQWLLRKELPVRLRVELR